MAKPITLKLATNVPVVVKLLDAFNAPSKDTDKFPNQVRLQVEHEGVQKNIYIPLGAAIEAKKTGILVENEPDEWGVAKQGNVTVAKREVEGSTRKDTVIHWLDSQVERPTAPAETESGTSEPEATTTVHPNGCRCDDCAEEQRIKREEAELDASIQKKGTDAATKKLWAQLDASYAASLMLATYHQCRMVGVYRTGEIDLVAAQAGAATILIHMQRTGMPPATPGILAGLRKRLEKQLKDGAPPEPKVEQPDVKDEPVPEDAEPVAVGTTAGEPDSDEDDDLPF